MPAFPDGVMAAKVRTEATQAGALGDPYGSGVRTVWWVFGVGPVKMIFEHAGGSDAPITTSELQATNQTPKPAACGRELLPAHQGAEAQVPLDEHEVDRRSRRSRSSTIDEVVNNSARFTFKHVSGPIKVAGSYGFATAHRRASRTSGG